LQLLALLFEKFSKHVVELSLLLLVDGTLDSESYLLSGEVVFHLLDHLFEGLTVMYALVLIFSSCLSYLSFQSHLLLMTGTHLSLLFGQLSLLSAALSQALVE